MLSKLKFISIAIILLGFSFAASSTQVEGDLFTHLTIAKWIFQHSTNPSVDILSWSNQGNAWTNHEWLWQISIYKLYSLIGVYGFWLIDFIGIFLFGICLYLLAVKDRISFVLWVLTLRILLPFWDARPHTLAQGLFALWIFIILKFNPKNKALAFFAGFLLMLIWGNIHVSVVIGVFAAGLYFIIHRDKRSLGLLAGSFLGSLLNPSHIKLYFYGLGLTGNSLFSKYIAELQSPDFHDLILLVTFISVTLAAIKAVIDKRTNHFEQIMSILTCVLFLTYFRHAPYYFFFACITYGNTLQNNFCIRKETFLAGTLAFFVLLYGLRFTPADLNTTRETTGLPIKAVQYMLSKNYTEKVFNPFSWGGYLAFNNIKCFIHGKAETFTDNGTVFEDYLKAYLLLDKNPANPEFIMKKYRIETILLPKDSMMPYLLKGWVCVYRDERAIVLRPR